MSSHNPEGFGNNEVLFKTLKFPVPRNGVNFQRKNADKHFTDLFSTVEIMRCLR